jgi:hypothetical protein
MRLSSMFSALSLFAAAHASASNTLHIFTPTIQLKREAIESEDHPDAREVIYLADESKGTKTPLFYSHEPARGLVRRTNPMSSRGVTFLQSVLENSVSDKATHGTLATVWDDGVLRVISLTGKSFEGPGASDFGFGRGTSDRFQQNLFALEVLHKETQKSSIFFFCLKSTYVMELRTDSPNRLLRYKLDAPLTFGKFTYFGAYEQGYIIGQVGEGEEEQPTQFKILLPEEASLPDGSGLKTLIAKSQNGAETAPSLRLNVLVYAQPEEGGGTSRSRSEQAIPSSHIYLSLGHPWSRASATKRNSENVVPPISKPVRPAGDPQRELVERVQASLERGKSVVLVGPQGSLLEEVLKEIPIEEHGPDGAVWRRPLTTLYRGQFLKDSYTGVAERGLSEHVYGPNQEFPRPIFFVPNGDSFVGLGSHATDENDWFAFVGQHLLSGPLRPLQFIFTVRKERFAKLPSEFVSAFCDVVQSPDLTSHPKLNDWLAQTALDRWALVLSPQVVQMATAVASRFSSIEAEPGRTLSLLEQYHHHAPYAHSPSEDSLRIFAWDYYRVPKAERDRGSAMEALRRFIPQLNERHVGDNDPKERLFNLYRMGLFGAEDPIGPRGKILLLSLPGGGRSSLIHAFSFALNNEAATVIDLAEHSTGSSHYTQRFLSLVGERLMVNPSTVFLFKNIEQASPEIQETLASLLSAPFLSFANTEAGSTAKHRALLNRSYWFFTSNSAQSFFVNETSHSKQFDPESLRFSLLQPRADLDGPSGRRPHASLVSKMEEVWALFGPENRAEIRDALLLHGNGLLRSLSSGKGNYPRLYSFHSGTEFVEAWMSSRHETSSDMGLGVEIRRFLRTLRLTIAIRNQVDALPLSQDCALTLLDLHEAVKTDA